MKNVEILCKIAMHIKTVGVCNTHIGTVFYNEDIPACLMCNAHRAGIVDYDTARSLDNPDGYVAFFDVSEDDWADVIYSWRSRRLADNCGNSLITGIDYYNAIVSMLTKYDSLHYLRRMEGTLFDGQVEFVMSGFRQFLDSDTES